MNKKSLEEIEQELNDIILQFYDIEPTISSVLKRNRKLTSEESDMFYTKLELLESNMNNFKLIKKIKLKKVI